jgi:hypothetical protein
MKGYIVVQDWEEYRRDEYYYLTIETSYLKPIADVVVDERFATYQSSKFIIKKITNYLDKTKNVKELYCVLPDSFIQFNATIGETKTDLEIDGIQIFKTLKGVQSYLGWFIRKPGWIKMHDANGSMTFKWLEKNGEIKDVSYFENAIVTRNYKKNKTFIKDLSGNIITTYPFITQPDIDGSYDPNPRKLLFHHTYYIIEDSCKMEYRYRYSKTHHTEKWSYSETYHGIIFDNKNSKNKCAVFWFHKLISNNLQTWYQTPWNFTLRIHKIKIKCF